MPIKKPVNGWVTVHARDIGGPTFLEPAPDGVNSRAANAANAVKNQANLTAAAAATSTNNKSPKLSREKTEKFHTVTAQGLFACKQARLDISPAIAYLTTQVRNRNESNWRKLVRMVKFLKQTVND